MRAITSLMKQYPGMSDFTMRLRLYAATSNDEQSTGVCVPLWWLEVNTYRFTATTEYALQTPQHRYTLRWPCGYLIFSVLSLAETRLLRKAWLWYCVRIHSDSMRVCEYASSQSLFAYVDGSCESRSSGLSVYTNLKISNINTTCKTCSTPKLYHLKK